VSEGAAAGDPGTVALLYLCMEVAGCPTVCRHCWAQGTGYGMMPLADIEWVLESAHRFCDGRGLGFDAYPMHELAAHPDAARLFGLFNSHSGTPVVGQGSNMVPSPPCRAVFRVPLWELNSPNSLAASGWAASSCIG